MVADAITSLPCYPAPPDDVAHLPCVVVEVEEGTRFSTPGSMWTLEHRVFVVGRRYDMADVPTELDDVTSAVIAELDLAGLPCNALTKGSVQVGGTNQPCYELPVSVTVNHCP